MKILYIGCYLDKQIVTSRGLRSFNAAGSNRIKRVSESLSENTEKIIVVSQAVSLRQRFSQNTIHQPIIRRLRKCIVICPFEIGVPFLGAFFSPFTLFACCRKLFRRENFDVVVIYNFNFALAVLSLYLRATSRCRIINNVEDIARPRLSDWYARSEVNALKQIYDSVWLFIVNSLSHGSIVPSENFLPYLSTQKNLIISGCIPMGKSNIKESSTNVTQILFSGKMLFEHGVGIVAEAMKLISAKIAPERVHLHVSGEETEGHLWLREELRDFNSVTFHGFLSREDYETILDKSQICLVLQNDCGRFGDLLVPSKAYEYLAGGKGVISTSVGDLPKLPSDVIKLIKFDAAELAMAILQFVDDPQLLIRQRKAAFNYSAANFSPLEVGRRIVRFARSL